VSIHLHKEIESLKKMILALSARVEESVRSAARSVSTRDGDLAQHVIDMDPTIDHMEVDVEEECLKILALHQPVANDLRFIIAVLKLNNDLERIGDLAVNIAEQSMGLASLPQIDIPFDLPGMRTKVQTMLKNSLDALVNTDADMARRVCQADDEVDAINREMYRQVEEAISENVANLKQQIRYLEVCRHLERIGDHCTNIAEDVVYMIKGNIVRHKPDTL
jgi:phosphate transport system protein